MIVQAEAGPFAVRGSPERAIQAFRAVGEAGRDAQSQLRRMLDLLKDGPTADRAGREPQPTLAGIPDLVARVSATGPQVRLAVTGTAAAIQGTPSWPRTGSSRRRSPTWSNTPAPPRARSGSTGRTAN